MKVSPHFSTVPRLRPYAALHLLRRSDAPLSLRRHQALPSSSPITPAPARSPPPPCNDPVRSSHAHVCDINASQSSKRLTRIINNDPRSTITSLPRRSFCITTETSRRCRLRLRTLCLRSLHRRVTGSLLENRGSIPLPQILYHLAVIPPYTHRLITLYKRLPTVTLL